MLSTGCIVINCLIVWSICENFFHVHFNNGPEHLTEGDCLGINSFDEISAAELGFQKFSPSELFFSKFFLCLFDDVCFEYSQVLVIFLLSKGSNIFLARQFYSFCCFSFSLLYYEHDIFFNPKFYSYILAVAYTIYLLLFVSISPALFHFWQVSWYYPSVAFFLSFCKLVFIRVTF